MSYEMPSYPERRGVSKRRVIDEANRLVPTVNLAERLAGPGRMQQFGAEWSTNCVLPDHSDRTPSFSVNPEKNLWFCHGCARGGDAVELARLAWGYSKDRAAAAAANLLDEFGYQIPECPRSWFEKNRRQLSVREKIRVARVEVLRRRLFRYALLPLIRASTPDELEFRAEVTRAWQDFQGVPVETLIDDYDHLGGA